MLFGLSEDTWLVIAVALVGITGVQFLWAWWGAILRDKKAGKKIELPWE